MRTGRFVFTTVSALYFGSLVGLAFVPGSASNRVFWLWPLLAFVPVGILLLLLVGRRRWWAAIGFGVLGAAWIEAAQSVWMPVGYAEAVDVFWAGAGVVTGVMIALAVTGPQRRSMRVHESHRIVAHSGSREIPQD
jgi:hypothetical protein